MVTPAFQYAVPKIFRCYRSANIAISRGIVSASSSGAPRRGGWDVKRSSSRQVRSAIPDRHRKKYQESSESTSPQRRSARYSDSSRRRPRSSDYYGNGDDGVDNDDDREEMFEFDEGIDSHRTKERPRYRRSNSSEDSRQRWDRRESETELSPEQTAVRSALGSVEDDLVYGISPVFYALESQRRQKLHRLFVQAKSVDAPSSPGPVRKADNNIAFGEIQRLANDLDIPIITVPKGELNLLSKNRPHQGVVLQAAPLSFNTISVLPPVSSEDSYDGENRLHECYVVLDEVTDPQNAGAIMRSSYFLGASGVIVCMRNSCGLTPVVSKASAGSMELMEIQGVTSMPRFLRAASRDGWRVIGMARGSGAVQAKNLVLDQPTLIVLGSEGSGLRTMVKQACDIIVEIGGRGRPDHVDSLNVSVAGAVALYQLLGR